MLSTKRELYRCYSPPHIAKTDSVAQAGEEEVTGIVPVTSLHLLLPGVLHQAPLCLPHQITRCVSVLFT